MSCKSCTRWTSCIISSRLPGLWLSSFACLSFNPLNRSSMPRRPVSVSPSRFSSVFILSEASSRPALCPLISSPSLSMYSSSFTPFWISLLYSGSTFRLLILFLVSRTLLSVLSNCSFEFFISSSFCFDFWLNWSYCFLSSTRRVSISDISASSTRASFSLELFSSSRGLWSLACSLRALYSLAVSCSSSSSKPSLSDAA